MTADEALAQLAGHNGIFPEFTDMQGVIHHTTPDTQRALLRANGVAAETDALVREALRDVEAAQQGNHVSPETVITADQPAMLRVKGMVEWRVSAEGTGAVLAEGQAEESISLPPLPEGLHDLHLQANSGAQTALLIVAPSRVPMLADTTGNDRIWGVMAALYGLTTAPRKPLADYRDLAAFAEVTGSTGAGFLGINPVHALGTAARDAISPYSPTHRGFLNTDYIALDGALPEGAPDELLDYSAHRAQQRPRLQAAFDAFLASGDSAARRAFQAFCADGGQALQDFARFEVISLRNGPDSRTWPDDTAGRRIDPRQTDFHLWMQWQADSQLAAAQQAARDAGMALGLYLDLAVGARLGGAESWGPKSATASAVSLGAPPDHLSPAGQNWQLAALSPHRLRQGRFEAFRFVLRQNMRHCGLLRIDHALGLNRSFWLPEDGTPGGYIRQPFRALMAIIAIEARRHGTVVVGEDLGLVPEGFREEMTASGLYGYSVLQYEKDEKGALLPAEALRPQSLACFGTHDTPTLEGFWQGRDIAWWQRLGWITEDEAARAVDRRTGEKRQLAALQAPAPLPQRAGAGLRDLVHENLARAPAGLVAVQLDDVLSIEEAQNLPGTIYDHPNWRRRYPQTIAQIAAGPDLEKTAHIMNRANRRSRPRKETT